jgi:hypothetical protein
MNVRREFARLVVGRQVVEALVGKVEAALVPLALEDSPPLLRRNLCSAVLGHHHVDAERMRSRPRPDVVVGGANVVHLGRRHLRVAALDDEVGLALEDVEFGDLGRDGRRDLDARGAQADETDALALEVHARPPGGMDQRPREALASRDVRPDRLRQDAHPGDQVLGGQRAAAADADAPEVVLLVVDGAIDIRAELDVLAQVQAVGDEVQVVENLGARRVSLAPAPLLPHLLGEGERVVWVLAVGPHTGVAVDPPRATDALRAVEHEDALTDLAEVVEEGQAGEPRADDDAVVIGDCRVSSHASTAFRWSERCPEGSV